MTNFELDFATVVRFLYKKKINETRNVKLTLMFERFVIRLIFTHLFTFHAETIVDYLTISQTHSRLSVECSGCCCNGGNGCDVLYTINTIIIMS